MKESVLTGVLLIFLTVFLYSQPGALDVTFGTNGIVISDLGSDSESANAVAIQPDDKIVIAGRIDIESDNAILVARYNTNGTLDPSFSVDGIVTTLIGTGDSQAYSVAIQQDGKIVIAGNSHNETSSEFTVVRYNSDGTLDHSFGVNGIATTDIGNDRDVGTSMIIQPDDKIVVAGYSRNGTDYDFAVVRYNSDGSLDNTFSVDGIITTALGSHYDRASSVALQQDGKIVVGGRSSSGTNLDFAVVRYNTGGTLDNTFGDNGIVTTDFGGLNEECYALTIQPDGKIILSGLSEEGSEGSTAVVRYNSDGTLDNTFSVDGIVTTLIGDYGSSGHSIALQQDGKIIVGGISYYNSEHYYYALVRYNSDGTLDHSFDDDGKLTTALGSRCDGCNAIAIQSDNKIIAAGSSYMDPDWHISLARYLSGLNVGMVDFSTDDNFMLIYPNPIQNEAILKYELLKEENITLELYDIQGRLIETFLSQEKRLAGMYEENLCIGNTVPAGSYLLVISNDTGRKAIHISKK